MVGAHIFFWWLVADNGRPCVAMSQRKNPRAAKNADDADPLANAIYLVFCLNFAYFFLDFSQVCMGRRDASRDRTCVESAAQDREGAPCCARADDATAFCKLGERKKNTTAKYIEKNKFVISLFFLFFWTRPFLGGGAVSFGAACASAGPPTLGRHAKRQRLQHVGRDKCFMCLPNISKIRPIMRITRV